MFLSDYLALTSCDWRCLNLVRIAQDALAGTVLPWGTARSRAAFFRARREVNKFGLDHLVSPVSWEHRQA